MIQHHENAISINLCCGIFIGAWLFQLTKRKVLTIRNSSARRRFGPNEEPLNASLPAPALSQTTTTTAAPGTGPQLPEGYDPVSFENHLHPYIDLDTIRSVDPGVLTHSPRKERTYPIEIMYETAATLSLNDAAVYLLTKQPTLDDVEFWVSPGSRRGTPHKVFDDERRIRSFYRLQRFFPHETSEDVEHALRIATKFKNDCFYYISATGPVSKGIKWASNDTKGAVTHALSINPMITDGIRSAMESHIDWVFR